MFPALGSQFILIMLASSVVSVISAEELTAVADMIVARNFRSFEFYLVATGMYLVMAFGFQAVFALIDRWLFAPWSKQSMIREFTINEFWYLLQATRWTILLAAVAFVGGGVVGLVVALMRIARVASDAGRCDGLHQGLSGHAAADAALPNLFRRQHVWHACRAMVSRGASRFTLYASAFLGEIWRGCIQAIPRGQWEGARSLALAYHHQLRFIILPQALRIATPPTVGFLVQLLKGTSLASIIGFVELTRAAQVVNNSTFRPFTVYALVAAIYFSLCWPLSRLADRLERRLARHHDPAALPHPKVTISTQLSA